MQHDASVHSLGDTACCAQAEQRSPKVIVPERRRLQQEAILVLLKPHRAVVSLR